MNFKAPAVLRTFFSLATIEALACLVFLLANPADQGKTATRLAVIALLAGSLLVSVWFTGLAFARRGWAEETFTRFVPVGTTWIRRARAAGAVFVVFCLAACLPAYRLGSYALYFTRLQPWLVWAMLVSFQALLVLLVSHCELTRADWSKIVGEERPILFAGLIVLALFLFFWLVVGVSRLGLVRDVFWDKTGVPLLNLQILAAGAVTLLAVGLRTVMAKPRRGLPWLDVVLFVLIWVVTALAWNGTPQTHSHFAPGPYPPNYEYYPYSDALNYDVDAQFPLIGIDQGGKGRAVDKPLYSTFLVFLDAIARQDVTTVVNLQVVALAVFPALLYLLGKSLHSRAVGLFVAVLAIFKEINAIGGSLIIWTVSTPKMLMSEFPSAVGLALLSLLVFLWLRDTRRKPVYAMAAGGVLGLLTMIRNNPWFLLPVIILIAGLVYGRQWKRWLAASGLFILVLLIAIAPWEWRNYRVRGTPFYFLRTFQTTVWQNRYQPVIPTGVAPTRQPLPTVSPGMQSTPDKQLPVQDASRPAGPGGGSLSRYTAVLYFVANNFSHNLITAAVTLPTSFLENDLDHVVNGQGAATPWAIGWNGSLDLEAVFLLLIELFLIALGIGACWARWKIAGLVPLLLSVGYLLALGLARTSGGRYIVPADWVTYFYFGLGVVQVGQWVARLWQPPEAGPQNFVLLTAAGEVGQGQGRWRNGYTAVLAVFLVGLSLPLSSTFFSNPYQVQTRSGMLKILADDGALDKLGYTSQEITSFTSLPGSFIGYGRALFPRYLDYQNDVYAKEIYNDLPNKAPHLVFELIIPKDWFTISLPLESSPAYFPNASDVIVLGCKEDNYIDSRAVIILPTAQELSAGQHPFIYLASPKKPLSCR